MKLSDIAVSLGVDFNANDVEVTALNALFEASTTELSFVSNASKVALVHLFERLKLGGFSVLDTQFINAHLKQFGAIELPNKKFKSIIENPIKMIV